MKTNNEKVIDYIALGDSLVAGAGIPLFEQGFVEKYAFLSSNTLVKPVTLTKYGLVGATTSNLLYSLRTNNKILKDLRHADIITVIIGANDLIQAGMVFLQTKDERILFEALDKSIGNIESIIKIINQSVAEYEGPFIIRVTNLYNPFPQIPQVDQWIQRFNRSLNLFSQLNNLKVADVYTVFKGETEKLLSLDGIHPNRLGYEKIAQAIYSVGYKPLPH